MNKKAVLILASLLLFISASHLTIGSENPWKDKYEKVGDLKIHYLEAGTGDRILVFIPGWTMPAEVWREQIPYFSARGFHVIAVDPRSQGKTTKTETGNTYQQQAADLHAFFHTLDLDPSYLVGWDTGVTMMLDYVSSPETLRPDKIVFVEGSPAALKSDDYPGEITAQQARKMLFQFEDDRKKATDRLVRGMFKTTQMEWMVNDLIKSSMQTPMGAAVSLYFDYFTGDRRPALDYVVFSSLIVTTTGNQAIGEYMKSKIAGSKLVTIEDAGSAIFLDKPQAFNQALEEFFGKY